MVTKLVPTLASAAFYAASFYLLAQALRHLPLGIAYAIWGGVGIILSCRRQRRCLQAAPRLDRGRRHPD